MILEGPHLIFVSGIPATGKTRVCEALAADHGFAHYNMECFPEGWPLPKLRPIWNRSRTEFVNELRASHERVALDWGFRPDMIQWVMELPPSTNRSTFPICSPSLCLP